MKRVYKKNPLNSLWKKHKNEILIGIGVGIVGFYFWKKSHKVHKLSGLDHTPMPIIPPVHNSNVLPVHNNNVLPVHQPVKIEARTLRDYTNYEYIPTRTALIRYY